MRQRRRLQFGIGTLLAAMAICAAFAAALKTLEIESESLGLFLVFGVVLTAAASAIAWTAANAPGASERLAVPLVASNLVNWAAWYFNRAAFLRMKEGLSGRIDVSPMAQCLLGAAQFHVFDVIAVAATCITVFAAWRRNKALLCAAASTALSLWLIVFCLGFLSASIHLTEMP